MISDNFVVGDNVYLNELRNFFFEVLGMMSVTHYGAIGDGRTDNYAPLQVAIDDAIRRHLIYIYVPWGRYRYRGHLENTDKVMFMGNSQARIYNDKTGEEIEVHQFGIGDAPVPTDIYDLTEDLILSADTPLSLSKGFYNTCGYNVYFHETTIDNLMAGPYEMFYYDGNQNLIFDTKTIFYEENDWLVQEHAYITNVVVDDRTKIPTSKAVYDFLKASYYTKAEVDELIASIDPDPPGPTPEEGTIFTSSLAPTTWTTDVEGFRYTASNAYGTWTCMSDGYTAGQSADSYSIKRLFDATEESLEWRSRTLSTDDNTYVYGTLMFPVLINPSLMHFNIAGGLYGGKCHIQLLKQNGEWETVYTIGSGNPHKASIPLDKDEFYKGIRIYSRVSPSSPIRYVTGYALKIDEGRWKEMT